VCELDRVIQSKWWSKLEVHGDEGGHEMKMIKLQLRREEREKQNQGDQGKGIRYVLFLVIKTL
jgi:hypothetical protein